LIIEYSFAEILNISLLFNGLDLWYK